MREKTRRGDAADAKQPGLGEGGIRELYDFNLSRPSLAPADPATGFDSVPSNATAA